MRLFGIPKGAVQPIVARILQAGGLQFQFPDRVASWCPVELLDSRFLLLRPKDIPALVASGRLDGGFAGWDHVVDQGLGKVGGLVQLVDLHSCSVLGEPANWMAAVPEAAAHQTFLELVADLSLHNRTCRVATEIPEVVSEWVEGLGVVAEVERATGSTEAYVPWLADCIVDVVHSGESLRQNGLRPIDLVMKSTVRLWGREGQVGPTETHLADIVRSGLDRLGLPICHSAEGGG